MKYLYLIAVTMLFACNTSSNEQPREADSARVDGTRMADTVLNGDSVPPGVTNPQPD